MRAIDVMRRAARNLRQAKGRTILTSLAIGVGAFTLTLSLAAGEGAREYADNLLKNNIDPQALFIVKDKSVTSTDAGNGIREYSDDLSSTSAASGRGVAIQTMTNDDIVKLRSRNDLSQVIPIYSLTAKYVVFAGNSKKYYTPLTYYDATTVSDVVAGSLPSLGNQINDNEILVPEQYLETLSLSAQDLVGKTVTITVSQSVATPSQDEIQQAFLNGGNTAVEELVKPKTKDFTYTVRAILKKPTLAIASNPRLHVSTNAAAELYSYSTKGSSNEDKFIGVTALAKGDPTKAKDDIQNSLGYSVQTAKDAQGLLFTFVNILQGIVAGFAGLALIASVFGIINTQYISVLERTSQIGLMKALGMRRRDIAKLFRYEAGWIGFLGGLVGVGLALLLGFLANPWITKTLDLSGQSLLVFVWWQILVLIVSLVIVAIIAGWFPARKAARLDPIEALRTE